MTNDLEREFHLAMENTYREAAKLGYRANYFLGMLHEHGGTEAARRLLSTPDTQAGLTELWRLKRLDLSVEAHVIEEPWSTLFTEAEIQEAHHRLKEYGYQPPTNN